jgi:alkylation response protein AidB-like acyl-CoA dehydrogenase
MTMVEEVRWGDVSDSDFRSELRRFIAEHDPGPPPPDHASKLAHQRMWARTLADGGWAAPAWPRAWGGMDLPLDKLVTYHEELALARTPSHPSPNAFIVGPTILAHGSEQQRRRFLRRIVRADDLWCQGFSEPDAGSDLPSLRTTALLDGDSYVVHGSKVWTSKAMDADWMFALARTDLHDEEARRRRRHLSYLLIPMASEGLTVRPLRDMTGGAWFGEVHLDDVRVPVEQRLGAAGDGWRLARHSLGHERSASRVSQVVTYRRVVDDLLEIARSRRRIDDPIIRQRLADVAVGVRLLGATFERVMGSVLEGRDPGPAASISRLFLATFEQRLHVLAVDLLGPYGTLSSDEPHVGEDGRWIWGFLNTRASTIGAGTAEMQRSTIAERMLGLPR